MKRMVVILGILMMAYATYAANATGVASGIESSINETQSMISILPIIGIVLLVAGVALIAAGVWAFKQSKQEGKKNYKIIGIIAAVIGVLVAFNGIAALLIGILAPSMFKMFMGMGGP